MALRRRNPKEDLLWLKWPLIVLGVVSIGAAGLYFSASAYRNSVQREELNITSDYDLINEQVREIANAEQVIVENIEAFNRMAANSVLDEEDRVGLLEDIGAIRSRYQLFPIGVEIREQDRILLEYPPDVAFPDDQISLRFSQVQVSLPLLHEGDLMRFLNDFLGAGRLLVTNQCTINDALEDQGDLLEVVQHQVAICSFYWYTLRREPFTGV